MVKSKVRRKELRKERERKIKEDEMKGLYRISGEYGNTIAMKSDGILSNAGEFIKYDNIIHITDKNNISRQNTIAFGLIGLAASTKLKTVEIQYDHGNLIIRDVNKENALRFVRAVREKISRSKTNKKDNEDILPFDRIKNAKELLDIGAISEDEYLKIKEKYLNQI